MARFALSVGMGLVGGCEAWGPDGHMIVAHMADQLLDSKVKSILSQDLGSTPLTSAATWCDDFDHSPEGKWSEPLHYINYPGQSCDFDWSRDCVGDMCNAGALLNYSGQVFDSSTSKASRLVALKFVIHMMGDIHQPLHVASADDRGGNNIKVNPKFSPSEGRRLGHSSGNLHRVWDTTIVDQIISEMSSESSQLTSGHHQDKNGKNGDEGHNWQLLSTELLHRLSGEWSQNLTAWRKIIDEDVAPGLPGALPHRNVAALKKGLTWVAGVTARTGCTYAYVGPDGNRIQTGANLGRDYYNFASPIVEIQLAKAAARLAQILSDVLEIYSVQAKAAEAVVMI